MLEDADRLAALESYEVLDTAPEAPFDDIVMLARRICETPIALISLVTGERQWFKANIGIDVPETPVGPSVCGHAVNQGSTLIIPDLTQDERTRDSVLVTGEPHLRFYAGVPLRTPGGHVLGTLCVIDTVPRPGALDAGQLAALEALARQTMLLLEARRNLLSSDASLLAGGIGTFEVDLATNEVTCSPEMCRLFGLPEARSYPASIFEELTVGRDAEAASTAQSRRDGSATPEVEYRIHRAGDGAVRWIWRRGAFTRDADGRMTAFVGTVQDVTDRKLNILRQQALLALGDTLRDAGDVGDALEAAGRLAGDTLDALRAGFLMVDESAGTVHIEREWTSFGVEARAGRYALDLFQQTMEHLQDGRALVMPELAAARWLGDDAWVYDRMGVSAQIVAPLRRGGAVVGALYVHSATPRRWSKDEVEFVQAIADRTEASIAKIRAERERMLLNEELSHRLKNTLTMVQAYARQTLKSAVDKGAVEAFDQRLFALGRAHDILLMQNWAAAKIGSVVEGVLAIHADRDRLLIAGPDLNLGPKAALSLSMLLHELATNAIKYGALSQDGGRVAVEWRVDHTDGRAALVIDWREAGGPPASAPKRQGFGSRLIRLGLVGAGVSKLDYAPAGLQAEFRAPLENLGES